MSTVVVKNGNVEFALRNLKQKNAKDGLLKAARERNEGYMKPGVKRRKAKKEAIINSRKEREEKDIIRTYWFFFYRRIIWEREF